MFRHTTHTHEARPERDVTVRLADSDDTRALLRLATLDSASLPAGPIVLAESGREMVAAVPVTGGPAIADPFHRTAAVVEMLELRAEQLRAGAPTDGQPTWRRRLP